MSRLAKTPKKLLVVEDDPGLQSQLRWCFEDYEVIVAEDRESALAQLRRHEPPVVLQDLGLPPDAEGSEIEIAVAAQATLAKKDVPVRVVSMPSRWRARYHAM